MRNKKNKNMGKRKFLQIAFIHIEVTIDGKYNILIQFKVKEK